MDPRTAITAATADVVRAKQAELERLNALEIQDQVMFAQVESIKGFHQAAIQIAERLCDTLCSKRNESIYDAARRIAEGARADMETRRNATTDDGVRELAKVRTMLQVLERAGF